MKVSIIIPVYGVEKYISKCLTSVANQTFTGFIECIIVDDCGTDNSICIAENFIKQYVGSIEFKIIHRTENGGLSEARNTGIEFSTGDYIYFLDSDDYIEDNCIETLMKIMLTKSPDIVVGNYGIHGDSFHPTIKEDKLIVGADKILKSYRNSEFYTMAWNKLLKKSFLTEHNLFFEPGLIHEDVSWNLQCLNWANSIYLTSCVTYNYIIRENSIATIRDNRKHIDGYLKGIKIDLLFIEENLFKNRVDNFIILVDRLIVATIMCARSAFPRPFFKELSIIYKIIISQTRSSQLIANKPFKIRLLLTSLKLRALFI